VTAVASRTPPPPKKHPPLFYRFAHALVRFYARFFLGWRVSGQANVPRAGGCVVASNHISAWDPPIMGISVPREVHYMAKKELFEKPLPARVFRGLRVFPVDRSGNDVGAIKEAMRRVQKGYAVGIFFEGTRNPTGTAAAQQGAAFIAQRTGVPLVPAAIRREGRGFHVVFGAPLTAAGNSKEDAAQLTEALARAVRDLLA